MPSVHNDCNRFNGARVYKPTAIAKQGASEAVLMDGARFSSQSKAARFHVGAVITDGGGIRKYLASAVLKSATGRH